MIQEADKNFKNLVNDPDTTEPYAQNDKTNIPVISPITSNNTQISDNLKIMDDNKNQDSKNKTKKIWVILFPIAIILIITTCVLFSKIDQTVLKIAFSWIGGSTERNEEEVDQVIAANIDEISAGVQSYLKDVYGIEFNVEYTGRSFPIVVVKMTNQPILHFRVSPKQNPDGLSSEVSVETEKNKKILQVVKYEETLSYKDVLEDHNYKIAMMNDISSLVENLLPGSTIDFLTNGKKVKISYDNTYLGTGYVYLSVPFNTDSITDTDIQHVWTILSSVAKASNGKVGILIGLENDFNVKMVQSQDNFYTDLSCPGYGHYTKMDKESFVKNFRDMFDHAGCYP